VKDQKFCDGCGNKCNRRTVQLAGCTVHAANERIPWQLRFAWAQSYLTPPVRWIVSFSAGGGSDTVARLVGQFLSERLGQQFIIENKGGPHTGPCSWPKRRRATSNCWNPRISSMECPAAMKEGRSRDRNSAGHRCERARHCVELEPRRVRGIRKGSASIFAAAGASIVGPQHQIDRLQASNEWSVSIRNRTAAGTADKDRTYDQASLDVCLASAILVVLSPFLRRRP
jgi:hypothetical protein